MELKVKITAKNKVEALATASTMLNGLRYDSDRSRNAGYPIYDGENGWASDLNTRIEVNIKNTDLDHLTFNIWIEG